MSKSIVSVVKVKDLQKDERMMFIDCSLRYRAGGECLVVKDNNIIAKFNENEMFYCTKSYEYVTKVENK